MLVLTTKRRESAVMENFERLESLLKLTVREIKGGGMKLEVKVADDSPVHRSDVLGMNLQVLARSHPP